MKSLSWAVAGTALMTGIMLLGQEPTSEVPVLSLSQAIQIAVDNNRPVNMAKLEIVKSNWEVAQTKTKRFPAITTYLFASGDITNPKFTFPADLFNNPTTADAEAFHRDYRVSLGGDSTTAVAAVPDPSRHSGAGAIR